ncbi:hypothetical protein FRC12_019833 [Ceratobasidium sp. 428]|nr:hypothetical protein FRC12_019833 [Ceratobasidium sp. 428]
MGRIFRTTPHGKTPTWIQPSQPRNASIIAQKYAKSTVVLRSMTHLVFLGIFEDERTLVKAVLRHPTYRTAPAR